MNGFSHEGTDPDYYRKMVIKIYWDDQDSPSVLAPLGDFFCIGHSIAANFNSLPFTVSAWPEQHNKYGGNCAVNCYLQMPFNKHARIEIENQADEPLVQYFYIDYELYRDPHPPNTYYFHAFWKRDSPTHGWAPLGMEPNTFEGDAHPNLDGKDNYVILDTEGAGNYIGCNHSVTNVQGGWWGEGDDMIFIDDDTWPPSMHGTGSEDYFNQAWDMNPGNAYHFNGSIVHERDVPGQQVSYRFHLADPVRFSKRIKVTMEHGHGNHLSNDWSSTAYWYQTLPGPRLDLLPVAKRLPRRPEWSNGDVKEPDFDSLDPTRQKLWKQWEQRREEHLKAREEFWGRRNVESKERAKKNVEYARELRSRWLAQS